MRRRLLAAGIVVFLVAVTWWLWAGGARGAEQATVIAVPLAALGALFAGIASLPARADAGRYAELLAKTIAVREQVALAQLLGDVGDPRPADVGFHQPLMVRWRTDGGDRTGSLAQITAYYRSLDRGR